MSSKVAPAPRTLRRGGGGVSRPKSTTTRKKSTRKAIAEDLDYDEEERLVRQVEEAYYREYYPEDEYTNQNQEMLLNSFAPNLLQLLTGMGAQPIMISNMGGGRGSMTRGNSRRRTHRSNRNHYEGSATITEIEN